MVTATKRSCQPYRNLLQVQCTDKNLFNYWRHRIYLDVKQFIVIPLTHVYASERDLSDSPVITKDQLISCFCKRKL